MPAVALPLGAKRPRGAHAMIRTLARERLDVVNTHSSTDTWLAAIACRWLDLRRRPRPALVRTRHVSIPVPNDAMTRWLYRRATQRIVADLARAGYIDRQREGRRNRYSIRPDLPLGLPLERDVEIGALVTILPGSSDSS